MQQTLLPNVDSYIAALVAVGKGGQWELALNIVRSMEERSITPNVETHNTLIAACNVKWELVLHLWQILPQASVIPEAGRQWHTVVYAFMHRKSATLEDP